MSLSCLPDDMVKKIFGLLLDRNTYRQSNYMSLALTCRRFYSIGVAQFDKIKRLNPETNELFALNTFVVKRDSYHQRKYPQMYKIYCDAHSDGWYDQCFERGLSVVLANRTNIVQGLRIVYYDLSKHYCLESIESTRLDKIVELSLVCCQLSCKSLYAILKRLRHLASLHLDRTHISEPDSIDEHPKIGLRYLYSSSNYIFAHPEMQIYAKVVVIGYQFAFSYIPDTFEARVQSLICIRVYLERFRHEIQLVRLVCYSFKLWSRIMQICGLQDIKWEIVHDTDVDGVCACPRQDSAKQYLHPERVNLFPRSGEPCMACFGPCRQRVICDEEMELFERAISKYRFL